MIRSTSNKTVGIVDYGVGNVASLQYSLKKAGYRVVIGFSEVDFVDVDVIFLPGVGSFSYGMDNLRTTRMDSFLINRFQAEDVPIVGICLGMQIMFEHSEEGDCSGLGLIEGTVGKFDKEECHVGWNFVETQNDIILDEKSAFYFNHSYKVQCADRYVSGTTKYQNEFPSIIQAKFFTGMQFHPEKSQHKGMQILMSIIGD